MPAPGVSDLADVDDTRDRGIAMAEEERHLVHALARQQRPRGNGVPERVHRWHRASRRRDLIAGRAYLVQDRKRRLTVLVCGALLRFAQLTRDVPLSERPAGAGGEHECFGSRIVY